MPQPMQGGLGFKNRSPSPGARHLSHRPYPTLDWEFLSPTWRTNQVNPESSLAASELLIRWAIYRRVSLWHFINIQLLA